MVRNYPMACAMSVATEALHTAYPRGQDITWHIPMQYERFRRFSNWVATIGDLCKPLVVGKNKKTSVCDTNAAL